MGRTAAVWILVAALGAFSVSAQQPKPKFEVASVKPQPERFTLGIPTARVLPGGVFSPTHITVKSLLMFAHDLKPFQILGGPDWVQRDLFQINARAGRDAPAEQVKLMVQSLLEDRFKLVTRTETRDMPFVAVVLARADGRLGPYIRQVDDDCTPATAAEYKKQFPARPEMTGGGTMRGACTPLSRMADSFAFFFNEPVLDKTGLTGKFVYEMRTASLSLTPNPASNADPNLPSLKEGLEEQLGLKLERRRGPIEVLVIDSVSQPTEN